MQGPKELLGSWSWTPGTIMVEFLSDGLRDSTGSSCYGFHIILQEIQNRPNAQTLNPLGV